MFKRETLIFIYKILIAIVRIEKKIQYNFIRFSEYRLTQNFNVGSKYITIKVESLDYNSWCFNLLRYGIEIKDVKEKFELGQDYNKKNCYHFIVSKPGLYIWFSDGEFLNL